MLIVRDLKRMDKRQKKEGERVRERERRTQGGRESHTHTERVREREGERRTQGGRERERGRV